MLYVQHLLGVGHLQRAAVLARALAAARCKVEVLCGGVAVPDVDFGGAAVTQLPPIRSDGADFSRLLTGDGKVVDDAYAASRRERLLEVVRDGRPDALIIEMFPFGRRQMRFELLPLLDAVWQMTPRPLVACSVRDILQIKRDPARRAEIVALVASRFDRVLVHGDPAFVRLEETFPEAVQIADKLVYTGFVVEPAPQTAVTPALGVDEVIVSAGGGAASGALYRCALAARPRCALRQARWRLLVGPNVGREEFQSLRESAPAGVIVERNRSRGEFRQLLAACAVSISQAGYNTVMDLLATDARAVLIPFVGPGETEQLLRAQRLEALELAELADEGTLSADGLARAVERARARPRPAMTLDLGGAAKSAQLIRRLAWR